MTGLPLPTENQAFCTVSALEAGHLDLPLPIFIDNAAPGSVIVAPSLSFLLSHSKSDKKFVFDLGIRKDLENSPPSVQTWNTAFFHATVSQDVSESLTAGGLSPADIDTVCISHCHWDHVGDTKPFINAEFVVGAASATLFQPGYPEDPDSGFASDLLPAGRTRFVEFDEKSVPLGPFPHALDFYGDGSLYIVNAAGHLPGHVLVIARTALDAWILLGGDSAHHWNLITGESQIADGRPGFASGCAHLDKKSAESNIQRIREFWKLPRTRVIIAHDEPWYKEHKGTSAFWPGHIESK
ncbi:Metallo-hydrolase/oxidoreductase [Gymnopus androsaceus JB14]|uniref:Metallo-hydrolase/oxidoreductase n=1 Tax=Gymnopus androsaceus JB14 TaxID=1447944 RepID=A0A6A4I243_9AGAR|nr:Metallo-hydrolase/oxidoreductase [Gymnopus androsaceus JB14]